MLRKIHNDLPGQSDLTDGQPLPIEVVEDDDDDEDEDELNEDEDVSEDELEEDEDEDEDELADGRDYDDFQSQIWKSLLMLQEPSVFVTAESRPVAANPVLHIPGHGTVGLPLSTHDACGIISRSKPSLLGNGEPNLFDDSPCRIWELDPSKMLITNPEWSNEVERFVSKTYKEFGLYHGRDKFSAKLSKLRLYESGSKDASILNVVVKPPEAWGTLFVCLPSSHQGGKLIFRHDHESYQFETQQNSAFNTFFATFYDDVPYEMTPITSGYCLMLCYDLLSDRTTKVTLRAPIVSKHKMKLRNLLKTYNQRLSEDDEQLPPVLLHKLDGVYGKDNLIWDTLVADDSAVVSALNEAGREHGFHLYLATLEMVVTRYDGDDGDDDDDDNGGQTTEHLLEVVELDGRRIATKMVLPDIHPVLKPYRTKRGAEHAHTVEHEGWDSYTSAETTYTYRDTVAVIVPPSRHVDFICEFGHDGNKIVKQMQELSALTARTGSQEHMLSRVCRIVIDGLYIPSRSQLFLEAARLALENDEDEVFHRACKKTSGKAALTHSRVLGLAIARFGGVGPTRMEYSIKAGLLRAPDLIARQRFLAEVEAGFETKSPPSDEIDVSMLKHYCNDMLLQVEFGPDELRKTDCSALAHLKQQVDWHSYYQHAKPKLLASNTPVKVAFLNAFTSSDVVLTKEQREFAAVITDSIWKSFTFVAVETSKPPVEQSSYLSTFYNTTVARKVPIMLTGDDLAGLILQSMTLLPGFDLDNHIIPRLLTMIFKAEAEVSASTFLPFIKAILELKYPVFSTIAPGQSAPEPHKILVQTMLGRYIWTNVGEEPKEPRNWKLPKNDSCQKYYNPLTSCNDCNVINNFLLDKNARQYDLTCGVQRQRHLSREYSQGSYETCTIRVKNRVNANPDTWRITKNRSMYQAELQKWSTNVSKAKMHLQALAATAVARDRLKAYLDPHHHLFMEARTEELPIIDTRMPFEGGRSANTESEILEAGNTRKRMQREGSDSSVEVLGSNKRARSELDKENVPDTDEVKIVDLTDM